MRTTPQRNEIMEISDIKIAIIGIVILEVAMGALSYLGGGSLDTGTVGMGITGIAGLAGYDFAKNTN